jgi:L-malate glycosyltransferase
MKIAIISLMSTAPWGGSEELWAATASAALKAGHEVIVSVPLWPKKPARISELEKAGVTFLFRSQQPQANSIFSKTSSYFKRKYETPYKKIFDKAPGCILISQGGTFDLVNEPTLTKSLQENSIPWYLLSQFNYDFGILGEERLQSARSVFPQAKKIFFVSERNKITTARQLANNLTNAAVVRNPLNLPDTNYVAMPAMNEPFQFGCVARLECNFKGQDILFEALSSDKWKARSWQLNLYGTGPDEKYLRLLAQHFGLADKIIFHGHIPDIKSIWAANHILLLPSIGEGTPLALTEAAICGRAAMVTNVGGHAEWITEGETGFIAESFSPIYIERAMERAWQQSARWEEMGNSARTAALQKIDPQPGTTLLNAITGVTG